MDQFPREEDMVLFSRDKEENTVLHVAAKFGHLAFVQSVLNKVGNAGGGSMLKHLVMIKNSDEQTLLHLACLSQASDEVSKEFIKYVLDKFDSHLLLQVVCFCLFYSGGSRPGSTALFKVNIVRK